MAWAGWFSAGRSSHNSSCCLLFGEDLIQHVRSGSVLLIDNLRTKQSVFSISISLQSVLHSSGFNIHKYKASAGRLTLCDAGCCWPGFEIWLGPCSCELDVASLCQYTLIKRLFRTASVLDMALRASSFAVYWINAASGSPPNTT